MEMFVRMKSVGLFLVLLAHVFSSVTYAQKPEIKMPEKGFCAHRGCMDTHPENTLPAFQEAIRLGAQMIEFDIQLTKDNRMVIMHDETVDRTTNGTGKVSDLTFAEIRALDAGKKMDPKFAGTIIPTFEETLAMMPKNVWLNCHLKGDEEIGKAAAALLKSSGRLHQAFLTCSEKASRAAVSQVPGILICNGENSYRKNTAKYVEETIKMKAGFIQLLVPEPGEDRKDLIASLKKSNVKINFFFARTPAEMNGLFDQGIDFILVNNLKDFLSEAKKIDLPVWKPLF